jgi:diguanylate cyclase (GGDEF)-like protein
MLGERLFILLLTGKDDDDSLVEGFNAGIDDFMTKPIREKVLTSRLQAAWRMIALQKRVKDDHMALKQAAADLAAANHHLKTTSMTDPLTGLPNRRYFDNRMAQAWATASRNNSHLSTMIVDVDYFKKVNDTYGHQAGDVVLQAVSKAMRNSLRQGDILARVGGDEFYVVCPGTSLQDVLIGAERLCMAIRDLEIKIPESEKPIKCSLSIGVASRNPSIENVGDLLKIADQGVYVVKERGKNNFASVQAPTLSTAPRTPIAPAAA